jgi:hypothetical protein
MFSTDTYEQMKKNTPMYKASSVDCAACSLKSRYTQAPRIVNLSLIAAVRSFVTTSIRPAKGRV